MTPALHSGRRSRRVVLGAALAALALAAPATAQRSGGSFFVGQPIDGPTPDIVAVGDIDISRDGTGAVAYVRREAGVDHAWVATLDGGALQSLVRVDPDLPGLIGRPALAAADGGRLAVTFANASGVYVAVRPGNGQPFGPAQPIGAVGAVNPAIDLAVNGTGYMAWQRVSVVEAAYLPRTATTFQQIPGSLNGGDASGGTLRPRVAAAADTIGVAVWGEHDATGRTHVVARRLVHGQASVVTADATVDPGGSADSPDVGIGDDSSYAWVGFLELFDNGAGTSVTRAVARRLRGSAFDDPVAIDSVPPSGASGSPRVGLNGGAMGMLLADAPGGGAYASVVRDDAPTPLLVGGPVLIGASPGPAPAPVGGYAENLEGVVAWFSAPAPDAPAEVRARTFEEDPGSTALPPFGDPVTLSDAALGPVDTAAGLDADVTRAGDGAAAFIQSAADGRRLVVAVYDRAPGTPALTTTSNWRSRSRPGLVWAPAFDLWGPVSYQLIVDGQPYATSVKPLYTPPLPIADGTHRWQVIATDRRGQVARSLSGIFRVDVTPPTLTSSFTGQRRQGKVLKLKLGGADLGSPDGSGLQQLRVDWGDGTPPVVSFKRSVTLAHVYRRGTFVARLSAKDHAGNATVRKWTLTIKKPKKKKKHKGSTKKQTTTKKAPTGSSPGGLTPLDTIQ